MSPGRPWRNCCARVSRRTRWRATAPRFVIGRPGSRCAMACRSRYPSLLRCCCSSSSTTPNALVQGGYKGKAGPMALNTLVHQIAVLSKAHQLRDLKDPCQYPKVKALVSMTRRAHVKRGALPHKKDAITKDPLDALLATCDESLRGKRDRALLLFAWSTGGRRRSEVAARTCDFSSPTRSGASPIS